MVTAPPPSPGDPGASESLELRTVERLLGMVERLELRLARLELAAHQLNNPGADLSRARDTVAGALVELRKGSPELVAHAYLELLELLRVGGAFPGRLLVRAATEALSQPEEGETGPHAPTPAAVELAAGYLGAVLEGLP